MDFELENQGEAQVEFLDKPPTYERTIHPRRYIPLIPERVEMAEEDIEEMKRSARLN